MHTSSVLSWFVEKLVFIFNGKFNPAFAKSNEHFQIFVGLLLHSRIFCWSSLALKVTGFFSIFRHSISWKNRGVSRKQQVRWDDGTPCWILENFVEFWLKKRIDHGFRADDLSRLLRILAMGVWRHAGVGCFACKEGARTAAAAGSRLWLISFVFCLRERWSIRPSLAHSRLKSWRSFAL